jgi:outer membrane lipoprotein-sorting protein
MMRHRLSRPLGRYMSTLRQAASFSLLLLLLTNSSRLPSEAAASKGAPADTSTSSILSQSKSGTALVDQLIGQFNNFGSYKFDGSQEAHSGGKVSKATGTFFFKPTNSMRVEVKDYGSKSGSILIRGGDGIKGKGGPAMFGMKMSLQSDSRLLRMPNGLSALDCDLGSLLNRLKKEAAAGCKIIVGNEPINVESLGARVVVIEAQKPDDSATPVVDRVFIDPVKKVPMQWDLFENGKFQSRSKFRNYETNLQIDDSQFKL